ncbi:helix-turn-helix transcriptional regulator [Paraburkholderia tropica]|uniref:helix-turn-helix transcriptional regulator n=1 Tax=Paraburkholderia tropica TaxID=92647 RepID=UPI003D2BE79B
MNENEMPHATGERLIRVREVLASVGLGKTTLYKLMKDGEFPRPRRVRNVSLWLESEVQGWIRAIGRR